ncbi:MAG: hypothetical protein Q4F12_04525 [Erysipelotrichaceae bacterium]|nr:hypothetical protein [Erysipelotrichaceae bacterium]
MKNNKKSNKKKFSIFCLRITVVIMFLITLVGCNKQTFKITFLDYDGTVLNIQEVEKNELPVYEGKTERKSDEMYEYTFISWDKEIVKATENTTYTAIYSSALINVDENENVDDSQTDIQEHVNNVVSLENYHYYVNFLDDDGTVLQRSTFKYGTMPSFKGTVSSKMVGDYSYTFKSWTPSLHTVTGTQTYTATYDKTYIGSSSNTPTPIDTDAIFTYKDKNSNSLTQKVPSGTTVTIEVGSGTITGLTSITVTDNQTIDLTSADYIPTPPTDYKFLGYEYDSSDIKFIAEYDDTVYKIKHAKTIYSNGEPACLEDAENSVITINGIDCYVLQVNGNKAELITKDIYNVRFDAGGHTEGDVMNYVGITTELYGDFSDKTYRYDYSTLKIWMDNFYTDYLGSDSRILDTTVSTITQKVFALDENEARTYFSKFNWDTSKTFIDRTDKKVDGFWTTGGWLNVSGWSLGIVVYNNSHVLMNTTVTASYIGARPAFWISLD